MPALGRFVEPGDEVPPALCVSGDLAIGQVRMGELDTSAALDLDESEFDGGRSRR